MTASSSKANSATGTKVIVQYRAKRGRVYELKGAEAVLAVHISPVLLSADSADVASEDSGNWHVQARSGAGPDPSTVDGWGATAAEALGEVARAWASHSPSLTVFDWDAVAKELHVIRAI